MQSDDALDWLIDFFMVQDSFHPGYESVRSWLPGRDWMSPVRYIRWFFVQCKLFIRQTVKKNDF